ncbi:MAG: ABC transporter ATP-binding protein [Candidatus Micrarchaeota archaeon]|nr:ABC transporter ATP-binding protein [Candidatus Micrarchaeota archaeon]
MRSIVADNAVKTFGDLRAVNGMTFSVSSGINMILGPNGAGKSTLLRCIDGLYRLSSGKISVFGEDPFKNEALKRRVSLLSDNYALYDYLTVKENIRFFGKLHGMDDKDIAGRSARVLRMLDAYKYLDKKVYTLSRGTKQKIAFCRSVINDPELLLLDEPSAFLDVNSSEAIRMFIEDYVREGRTVLYVTQKLDEVTRFNARILIIKGGRLIKDTRTGALDLLRNSSVDIRLAQAVDAKAQRMIRSIPGTRLSGQTLRIKVRSYRDVNRALRALIENGVYVIGVDYLEPFAEKVS